MWLANSVQRGRASLTLQDVDGGAVVSLLDDATAFGQAGGMHAVHDGQDLHTPDNMGL